MSFQLEYLPYLFAAGLACSLGFTRLAQGLGRRIGLVDQPDGRRKIHARVVPLVGGIAVFAASVLVLGVAFVTPGPIANTVNSQSNELLGLLLGSALICGVRT